MLLVLALACLAIEVYSTPVSLIYPRQIVVQPSTSSSDGSSNANAKIPLSAIIAISAVLAVGIAITVALQVRAWRRKRRDRRAEALRATSLVSLTAEELAGTSGRNSSNGTNARRGRGRRPRGRALRRTESGRSVKTLPEYSKEAGDEELVLVRRQSGSQSDDEYVDDRDEQHVRIETVEERDEDEQQGLVGNRHVPITIRSASPSGSRSSLERDLADGGDGRPTMIQTAPPLGQSMEMLQTRPRDEAPSYLEAMSSHDPDAPRPVQVPGPRPSALQRTASGFREFITKPFAPGSFRSTALDPTPGRQRGASTSSNLLHPTMSRYSTASASTGADYPSPWASSHSLLISPPVPNTAVRASFDGASIPKGGLTKEQMRFLSSSEAANLMGTRLDEVPAHKRRRRSELSPHGSPGSDHAGRGAELGDIPPPSWAQLEGERRRSEAYDRRNLAVAVDHTGSADGVMGDGEQAAIAVELAPGEAADVGDGPDVGNEPKSNT